MKISALKYLIELSDSSSINEAAHKLCVSQSSLSKSLRLMEEELGFSLFFRSNTGIELTDMGKVVLEDAKKVVEMYDKWLMLPRSRSLNSLKIYCSCSFSDFLVPDAIIQMKEKYPHLHISYHSVGNSEDYISPDPADPVLVMTACDKKQGKSLTRIQGNPPLDLMEGEYQCLINHKNYLSKQKKISVEELQDMYLIIPMTSTEMRSPKALIAPIVTNILHSDPVHVMEAGSLKNVIDVVREWKRSFAVSFYPALYRYEGVTDKKLIPIPFSKLHTAGTLCLFYSSKAAKTYPEIADFVKIISQNAQDFLEKYNQSTY